MPPLVFAFGAWGSFECPLKRDHANEPDTK